MVHAKIESTKTLYQQPFFMEIFIIAAWEIWRIRNGKIFDNRQPTLQLWTLNFKEQIILHLHQVPDGLRQIIRDWFDHSFCLAYPFFLSFSFDWSPSWGLVCLHFVFSL